MYDLDEFIVRRVRSFVMAVFAVGCVIFALNQLLPRVAEAATSAWSQPVELSDSSSSTWAWFPAISADDQGNVYVVWNAELPKPRTFNVDGLWFTRWNGHDWTKPANIGLTLNGDALRTALVSDPLGELYMLFKGFGSYDPVYVSHTSPATESIWMSEAPGSRADNVNEWQRPVALSKGQEPYFSDLAIDSKGVLHAIWTEGDQKGSWAIYYSHSTDGGHDWSPRIPLDSGNPVWWYRAHLRIDQKDRIYVVWEVLDKATQADGNGNGARGNAPFGDTKMAYLALSKDGGTTWTMTEFKGHTVTPTFGKPFTVGPLAPSVGVDGAGTILLVYREYGTNRILFQRSADGTHWSVPAQIPGVKSGVDRPYDVYSMATDSSGHVHLAMVGFLNNSRDMSVLHSEWDGSAWSAPQTIAAAPPYPEYPQIAIGQGNHMYVTWFVGNTADGNRSPIGIWYSSALASAPQTTRNWKPGGAAVDAAPTATPAPLPVPTIDPFGDLSPVNAPPSGGGDHWYTALAGLSRNPTFGAVAGPVASIAVVLLTFVIKSRLMHGKVTSYRTRR